MSLTSTVDALASKLSRPDTQIATLQALLESSTQGHDIAPAAEKIVQYCLYSAQGTTSALLSLSLDCLIASPAHALWVDALSIVMENLERSATSACLVVLTKIPSLPHAALQHLALYAVTPLIRCLSEDASPAIRNYAVQSVAAFLLRDRPLTAESIDAVRLEPLSVDQLQVVRRSMQRLLLALMDAIFDGAPEVAVAALTVLTRYALSGIRLEPSFLSATKRAMSLSIWDLLLPNMKKIADRFTSVVRKGDIQQKKEAIRAISRLVAYILSGLDGGETRQQAIAVAIKWVDAELSAICEEETFEMASCAATCMLLICSYAVENPSVERVTNWGIKAVKRITGLLHKKGSSVPIIVMAGMLRDAANGLAALSKNEFVNSKFIIYTAIGLLPFAARCPGRDTRLQAISVIASTVVEYDLSGRDTGVAESLRAVLSSGSWKDIIKSSKSNTNVPAELVAAFAQSLLEASRKIFSVNDSTLRLSLTHNWAVMLSLLMKNTVECLNWPLSKASNFAKELYLKLFDALGQYSSFLMRSQGIGMEEYENMQGMIVTAALEQKQASMRASLLVCITKYWLTTGMKAESNAGHMLKAIWMHAQEHYHDEKLLLTELKTGALWSEGKTGMKTRAEKAIEGGYVGVTTAISKKTKLVFDAVGESATNFIENRFFASIALSTAAAEGSTLATDYIYSSLNALLALVHQNPPVAERAVKLLNRYMGIMNQAESADFIAIEAVGNTVSALNMYRDEFFPKAVAARSLEGIMNHDALQIESTSDDPLAWMEGITESCVFATSRLENPSEVALTVAAEEVLLHIAAATRKRMYAFSPATLQGYDRDTRDSVQGDQQILHGASDPFGVVASHSMDTVKGLALLQIEITNRSKFKVPNPALTFSAAGALMPLPDSASTIALGTIGEGMAVTQRVTLQVRSGQGYAGRVFFSIHTRRGREDAKDGRTEEQCCVPYYVPSSDVLLLRRPPQNAGVDVFRRRWDLMRHSISFHVALRRDQTLDSFVDMLERRSKCLKEVGRMRTYSHVSTLVADSSRGDYVSVAALAPEARGMSGNGPCVIYVTIRSNSEGYNIAFRDECREWLKAKFRIIFLNEYISEEDIALALRPQDAYFITESPKKLSPYQRWRAAHAVRVTY